MRMKKRTVTTFIAILGILGVLSGCGGRETAAAPEAPQAAETVTAAAPVTEEPVITPDEGTLAKYLVGIRDRNVLKGARDINYLSEAESMKQVITGIEVDDHEVDTAKAGTYTVRYKITVNTKNLEKAEAYIREHPEAAVLKPVPAGAPENRKEQENIREEAPGETAKPAQPDESEASREISADVPEDAAGQEDPFEDTEQTVQDAPEGATGEGEMAAAKEPETGEHLQEMLPKIPESVFGDGEGGGTPEETMEVIVEKEVKIVTPDEAEEIIKEGGEVWTDGSAPVRIEDLEKQEEAVTGDTAAAAEPEPVNRNEEDTPEETREHDDSSDDDGGKDSHEEEHQESSHTHDWVKQTKTVHHDEEGHFEDVQKGTRTVVDEEAWDEPVYETKAVCSACGYEADSTSEINDHLDTHYDPELGYSDASYSTKRVQVDTIHHPEKTHEEPVYEQEWRVDRKAWDETVVTGYRCRTCGAEK